MELRRLVQPEKVTHFGRGSVALTATQGIKIEINGEEYLKVDVPDGKVWNVEITVSVREFDA